MQSILIGILFSMLGNVQLATAQEPVSVNRKNMLKVAIPVGKEYYALAYERILGQRWSVQTEGGYLANKGLSNIDFEGAEFKLQGKRYLDLIDAKAPEGIYLSPFARYRFLDSRTTYTTDSRITRRDLYSLVGLGAQLGGQWLFFNNRVGLEGYFGPAYNIELGNAVSDAPFRSTKAEDKLNGSGTRRGWGLTGGIQVGFAF